MVGIVPILLIQFVLRSQFHKHEGIIEKLAAPLSTAAASVSDRIDRNLFERYGDVQAFGYNVAVEQKTDWYKPGAENSRIVRAMNSYIVAYGLYNLSVFVDVHGKVIAVNDIAANGKAIDSSFIYQMNFSDSKWFKDSLSGNFYTDGKALTGTVMEDFYVDPIIKRVHNNDGLTLGFSAPVKSDSGEILGVWKNFADFPLVEQIVMDAAKELKEQYPQGLKITVLNNEGTVLVDFNDIRDASGYVRDLNVIGKSNLLSQEIAGIKEAISGKAGVTEGIDSFDSSRSFNGYAPFRGALGFKGMPWIMLLRVPENVVLSSYNQLNWILLCLLLGTVVVVACGSYLFSMKLAKPIIESLKLMEASAGEVRGSASQVSTSAQSLAQGATEQASSLQETAASLEEISSMSKQNADNSRQAHQLSSAVKDASQKSAGYMEEMSKAIYSIKGAADETALIVRIIDDIAFQTNLLALNAAVEAARAGDAGKGFAVVAEEVRNLAQRSATAAKETSQKINLSKELADNGVKVTSQVAESLKEILSNAVRSSTLVEEIAAASREQATGVSQVNTAVSELDQVTQQNSAAAEESSAAAHELTSQAHTMDEIVQELGKVVFGNDVKNKVKKTRSDNKPQARVPVASLASKPKTSHKPVARNTKSDDNFFNPNGKQNTAESISRLDDEDFAGF